jgi:ABC-type nitrate/sulfonate/bicarbonate transport system substrate-binding protein
MRHAVLALAVAALTGAPAMAETKIEVTLFAGSGSLPIYVAADAGLFAKEGLVANLTATPSSGALIQGLVAGKYQFAYAGVDNYLAYDEGQGTSPTEKTPDIVIIAGGSPIELTLLAVPSIKSYADLKGKTLAVDSVSTGFAFVLRKMLEKNGLGPNDYKFEAVGSTQKRWEAMKEGKALASLINPPFTGQALAMGYTNLGDGLDILGSYLGSVHGADRSWAKANETTVVGYVRAIVAATRWLYDPANADAAAKILMGRVAGLTEPQAKGGVASVTKGRAALAKDAAVDMAGLKTVIELREQYGEPKKKMGAPEKYMDLGYYKKALGS